MAQDDSFFGKDFVVNPLDEGKKSQVKKGRPPSSKIKKLDTNKPEEPIISSEEVIDKDRADQSPTGDSIKIDKLGVIVNGIEKNHIRDTMRCFTDLIFGRGVKPATIIAIGGSSSIKEEIGSAQIKKLLTLGGSISEANKPPSKYSLKSSPGWIIHTAQGIYVLEGDTDISRFVTEQGEFALYKLGKIAPTTNSSELTKSSNSNSNLSPAERAKRAQEKLRSMKKGGKH